MIRFKSRLGYVAFVAFVITATLSLGACSKKKTNTSDAGVIESGGGMSDSERDGLARGADYTPQSQLQSVYFAFDRSELLQDARETLRVNAEWIKSNSGKRVQIEGHCDERGTEEYNLALGERRANSVKNYLVSLGIDSERLFTISYGEELPDDPRHTEDAWSKNRRAQFLATK